MSNAATRTRKPFPELGLSPEKGNEVVGLLLAAALVLLAGSLLSYHPLDPSVLHRVADESARTHNLIGPMGAQIAGLCFSFLGLTALLLPVFLAIAAWRRLKGRESPKSMARVLGIVAVLPAMPAMFQLLLGAISWRGEALNAGGVIGVVTSDILTAKLNFGGSFVILLAILLIGGSLVVRSTLKELLVSFQGYLGGLWERFQLFRAQYRKRRQEKAARWRVTEHRPAGGAEPAPPRRLPKIDLTLRRSRSEAPSARLPAESTAAVPTPAPAPPRNDPPLRVVEKKGEGHFAVRRVRPSRAVSAEISPRGQIPSAEARAPRAARSAAGRTGTAARQQSLGFRPEEIKPSELPPVSLLRTDSPDRNHDEKDLMRLGEVIREAFEHFGIAGTIEGISPGPVITVYEFQPAPGIKVSRIVNLQDDLALALKAESVRIERLPGRSTLGIEVPNRNRYLIRFGELVDKDKFQRAPSPLTVALGVDIYGRPFYSDLATMPHLLVAGATGAGKSVGLQSMITSIIYKASRDQVQFIFIDPKRIELGVYARIPHLKTEVVVEPKKAANALRWAVAEMERRYRLLAKVHVRSIDYYNRVVGDPRERQRLALKEGESESEADDFKPLPYYVIVIDELADLMIVASAEVEPSIARLAQMARAVGIHLIIATQRPSVDVLTGTIKANFPCRLSYATASRHDSRTILDQVGAEKLLGKGDALFIAPGTSRIQRLHGAYISEQETAGLVRWLKKQGKPELDLDILKDPDSSAEGAGGGSGGDDEMFDEAARLVVAERQASASFLQRRLRIGFSRAARLIDMMEADGLLGPSQGSKPREVLVKADYFEEIDRARMGV